MPSKYIEKIDTISYLTKPIVIKDENNIPTFTNNVHTRYAIVDNNKSFKSISDGLGDIENLVVYNKANDKLYSLNDGKKKCIAVNKTGEPLTGDNFGKKMKPLSIDMSTDDLPKTKLKSNVRTNLFNNLHTQKINGVDFTNLVKRVESLESIVSSLTDSGDSSNDANEDTDNDPITGLKTRVTSLENAVKLDSINDSFEKSASIDYYLNQNFNDIQINSSSIDSILTRLSSVETLNQDLLATIGILTGKVEALELQI